MKLVIILDGAAEDCDDSEPTTLEIARLPTLDRLARNSVSGLFDPCDCETGTVQTETVVASMLGIRPRTWPGRPFYELSTYGRLEGHSFAAILSFRSNDGDRDQYAAEIRRRVVARRAQIGRELGRFDLAAIDRPHSRLGLSLLVYGAVNVEDKTLEHMRQVLDTMLAEDQIQVSWLDCWRNSSDSQPYPQFCGSPAVFSFSRGSLPSIVGAAGIENLAPPQRTEFSPCGRIVAFENFVSTVCKQRWRTAILYFKDPDWASHKGDRIAKIEALESFDSLLGLGLPQIEARGLSAILVFSDHRTNIGALEPSRTPSPFWLLTPREKNSGQTFCERAVEENWGRPPLNINDVHSRMFHTANTEDEICGKTDLI